MIYLDTSALVKLLVAEPESVALGSWLGQRAGTWLTSTITEVELPVAASRYILAAGTAEHLIERLSLVEMTPDVRRSASAHGSLGLRTLDAIHVASAQSVHTRELPITVVTYDQRVATACRALDLIVISPGGPGAAAVE